MPRSYWQASDRGTLDSEDPISVNSRLIDLEQDAIRYGFAGLFDAVLAMAKSEAPSFKQSTDTFVQGGGLSELIGDCLRSPEYIGNLPAHLGKVMTDTVGTLYLQEWRKLVSHSGFRRPLTSLSADYAKEFSFTDIYRAMTSCAPSLIQLFSLLTEKTMVTPSATTAEAIELKRQRIEMQRQRLVVISLSVLGRQQNQQFNAFQSFCTVFLFANNTPKRVIEVLNQFGISVSYTSLMRGLDSNAKHFAQRLRDVSRAGLANLVVMDNIQFKANVRDHRVLNSGSFITGTAAYVLVPPAGRQLQMATPADCKYDLAHRLTSRDFIPTSADQEIIELGFRSMIWSVVRSSAKAHGVRAARLKFPMPSVFPLNPRDPPEILPLRTYHLDEGIIDELVDVLYLVQGDIGLSEEQATSKIMAFRGDLLTTLQYRYGLMIVG
jgi:hypothetical protein